jgi:dipeptidyl aminopeptidase/acylaminoacyl peptidase
MEDAENYPLSGLRRLPFGYASRSLPTIIFHGIHDDVVPIQVSRDYARQHSQVKLIELNSDHGLNDHKAQMWQEIQDFID